MKTNEQYTEEEIDKKAVAELSNHIMAVCKKHGLPVLAIIGVPNTGITHVVAGGMDHPEVRNNIAEAIMTVVADLGRRAEKGEDDEENA